MDFQNARVADENNLQAVRKNVLFVVHMRLGQRVNDRGRRWRGHLCRSPEIACEEKHGKEQRAPPPNFRTEPPCDGPAPSRTLETLLRGRP